MQDAARRHRAHHVASALPNYLAVFQSGSTSVAAYRVTEGKPSFNRALASEGFTEDEVLRLAASLDQGSEHPLAEAIVRAARERGLVLETPETFKSRSGIGVSGRVHGRSVLLRNTTMLTDAGIETGHMSSQAEPLAHARWEVSRRDWTPGAHPMGLLG